MYSLTIGLKEDREEYEAKQNIQLSPVSDALLLYQNGEVDKASQLFDQIVNNDPSNYKTRILLAEIYHEQCIEKDTNCEQALWQLDYLIEHFPTEIRPLEMRSKIFLKLKDTISARNDVLKISNINAN